MASASVRLLKGASFNGRGYTFKTNGETKLITNDGDIAYFKGNQRFKVTDLKGAAPAAPARKSKPPAPPQPSTNTSDDDAGGGGPLPWKGNMKKVDLIAAAESRDIAVTEDDKVADIVQLLREWDDENNGGE